jgi:hypothetical protein
MGIRTSCFAVLYIIAAAQNALAEEEEEIEYSASAKTLPQLIAARGGSLGIPSTTEEGFQSSVDAKLEDGIPTVELLTKFGGLSLGKAKIDFFGETFKQDLPRFLRSESSLKKDLFDSSIISTGLRLNVNLKRILYVSNTQSDDCMAALKIDNAAKELLSGTSPKNIVKGLPAAKKSFEEAKANELALNPATADATDIADAQNRTDQKLRKVLALEAAILGLADCHTDQWIGERFYAFNIGARVIRRSSTAGKDGSAAIGYAIELIGRYVKETESLGWTIFIGASAMGFNDSQDVEALSTVEYPSFNQLRLTTGAEFRSGTFRNPKSDASRFGIYAVGGHAWWTDPYDFGTIERHIQSSEYEFGVYAGGQLQKNFHGLVALRFVKPYGTDRENLFIISLIPSLSREDK